MTLAFSPVEVGARGAVSADSGVRNDLWLLWGKQSEGAVRVGEAEAVAVVQTDSKDWGSCLRVPGGGSTDQPASHLQPHHPTFQLRKLRSKAGPQGILSITLRPGRCPEARKAGSLRRTWEQAETDGRSAISLSWTFCELPLEPEPGCFGAAGASAGGGDGGGQ